MLAFTDTEVSKEQLLASLEAHAAADRFQRGAYWEDGKGCAVGCTLHDFRPGKESNHNLYPELFGIPRDLAELEDAIFEGLPNGSAAEWPLRFTRAIKPGSDLTMVWHRFAAWLLTDPVDGVIRFAENDRQRDAIRNVARLHERVFGGEAPKEKEWDAAWAAAWAAGRGLALAAASAAARDAALASAAAWAAASAAARDAALASAAAWAAAGAAARDAAYKRQADKLIELIEAT